MLPPIIIFAYNRPRHFLELLESIRKNNKNIKNQFILFCDGPKNNIDKIKIDEIKKIIKQKKFKFNKKIFRKKNVGLAKNIIQGVSSVLEKNKNCIVLEDDLLLKKNSINFMNKFLINFDKNNKIGSVSAHSYLDSFKKYKNFDYYYTKRHSSWCWGTWSRVWNKINWKSLNYERHFKNIQDMHKFSKGGNDLNLLLWGQYKNYINSWAIRFNYFCSKKNLISFQPRFSMIVNNGRDSSGTHESFSIRRQNIKNFIPNMKIKKKDLEKKVLSNIEIDEYIKKNHRKSIKLSIRYMLKNKKKILA